jgi:hypothetical protein
MRSYFLVLVLAAMTMPLFGQGTGSMVVDRGCLGDCAMHTSWVFRVPEMGGTMRFSIVPAEYTLCPSHRAGLRVMVNGKEVDRFALNPITSQAFTVRGGDVIRVEGRVELVHAGIRCIEFGHVQYTMTVDRMRQGVESIPQQ